MNLKSVPQILFQNVKIFIFYVIFLFTSTIVLTACQKGKELESPGFGSLTVISSFSADASPLLVQIDGKTEDTLTTDKPSINGFPIKEGERHLVFINLTNKKVITDTTIKIERQKTFTLPTFLYTGTGALFDDLTAKPEAGSMLVRFVNTDPTLPNVMDIEISLWDFGGTRYPVTSKILKGIGKDKFGSFIQLPNPSKVLPAGIDPAPFFYFIEGFDPANGNKKVMSTDEANACYLFDPDSFAAFTPNVVLSLGIPPPSEFTTFREASTIFRRVVQ